MWGWEWSESMKDKLKWLGIGALAFGVGLIVHRSLQANQSKGKAKRLRTEPMANKKV